MIIARRIARDPNNAKAAGVARVAYNWALAERQRQYAAWNLNNSLPKPSQQALRRRLNAIKREPFPWMPEVATCAPQMAIIQFGEAFKPFQAGRAKHPKFRKKGVHDRVTLANDQFSLDVRRIRIPNPGWVRMRESLRVPGTIMSAAVSRASDRRFVSITVDADDPPKRRAENEPQDKSQVKGEVRRSQNQGAAGGDLGASALATLSTGETIAGPKPHTALRLRRLSRSRSRKQKGSRNRATAKTKLARLHARIANIRQDALHTLTTNLTRRFHAIVIKDLNVRGMVGNRHLARSIADMGFYEFRRQLECKAAMRGGGRSSAPVQQDLFGLRDGSEKNAAGNTPAVSSAVSACGEEGSGLGRKRKTKPTSVKQEVSFVPV